MADQPAVRALVLAGLAEHWVTVDASLNQDLDDLATEYANGRTVVILDADAIIATGTVVPRDDAAAMVVRMSVAVDRRGEGLGRQVLDSLVQTATEWGRSR